MNIFDEFIEIIKHLECDKKGIGTLFKTRLTSKG
jgi:hypothetical protein